MSLQQRAGLVEQREHVERHAAILCDRMAKLTDQIRADLSVLRYLALLVEAVIDDPLPAPGDDDQGGPIGHEGHQGNHGSENIDDEVLNNVKNSNKSVLEFNSTSDFENYYNFYDEITNEELVHVA